MASKTINIKEKVYSNPPKNGKYYLVAIDGRGGSGKTTLALYLKQILPGLSFICGDDYFEPIEHPVVWGGYNEERFYKDAIAPLKAGQRAVNYRPYNWDNKPHTKNYRLKIKDGAVIDRCYSFSFDLDYDLTIWVETPREITLKRGISRSTMPRERAEKVWRELWKPMEDRYILEIQPEKKADIVVDGTLPYDHQITT